MTPTKNTSVRCPWSHRGLTLHDDTKAGERTTCGYCNSEVLVVMGQGSTRGRKLRVHNTTMDVVEAQKAAAIKRELDLRQSCIERLLELPTGTEVTIVPGLTEVSRDIDPYAQPWTATFIGVAAGEAIIQTSEGLRNMDPTFISQANDNAWSRR